MAGRCGQITSFGGELTTQVFTFSGPDHEDWLSVFVEISAEPFPAPTHVNPN